MVKIEVAEDCEGESVDQKHSRSVGFLGRSKLNARVFAQLQPFCPGRHNFLSDASIRSCKMNDLHSQNISHLVCTDAG